MKIVTYNIQYGIGLDGRYDVGRIADAVRGADVIALQEVTRNNPRNGDRDMVAEISEALPDYFAAYGSNFEVNVGSRVDAGRAVTRTFQLGNMVLSKTPIHLSRNLLLPRSRSLETMNFQRGALEALIETPLGFIRFYSTHLDHRSPVERQGQIRFLRQRLLNYALEGGGLSGIPEIGLPDLPYPEAFIVMGDFNMLPGSPEYVELAGRPDHEFGMPLTADLAVDVAQRLAVADLITWVDPERPDDKSRHKCIDYIFTSASLARSLQRLWSDRDAVGSDHLPLWAELG
ncbi:MULTISPECIES: endonuclease/exonuclease/phosphatase family protein [unclassified Mesorhizobium]|uniref:endonuclease/exonuclease/phosphatase family protein n=1 Tax=unclassified Mesorhizobium TaxID=325217 RepID=UPI000F758D02|nr:MULTISPECIES: endonuclease/exonuclease/phosphatase family protein [unclassified Mesorhizobium]AZO03699.1 EEP domain-containing protein [Mesorhizobium sp. M2A.F.Ca.ET.043.02.1.1]RUW42263.1 EEP domain-containing protein [Mesorhizobium sp. M2A.F.Ca.ET.015.02.1.1]RUW80875.1 EEP domain-containing protein [Mesorhizobium sp. M2A.F.Ca.ET.067.02.1.1]RVC96490.1 EEP domain-containing protein [Mesorhizobium sp. M2A.F.Ca.ET.017.03.2.1]RVD11760.1 EEP domain-containing protein [Mesorhizobium sp. M2A.F.Ca.